MHYYLLLIKALVGGELKNYQHEEYAKNPYDAIKCFSDKLIAADRVILADPRGAYFLIKSEDVRSVQVNRD